MRQGFWETTKQPAVVMREEQPLVPALTVVTHPDPERVGETAVLRALAHKRRQPLSRLEPRFCPPQSAFGRPLEDPYLSRSPLALEMNQAGQITFFRGSMKTAVLVGGQPLIDGMAVATEALERGVSLSFNDRILLLLHWAPAMDQVLAGRYGLVGQSDAMAFVRAEMERVADLPVPVLLRGESGTGKELVARAIHAIAAEKRPFIPVNMGAVPPNLATSELFGAVKGSFTGASRDQIGFFRQAHGGTLFLDEIGEASPEVQVLMLRALETGEIFPVGSQRAMNIDVRLIAATDANLEAMLKTDSFKAPLLHRLSGFELCLPPLRHRLEDFGRLFFHFAQEELKLLGTQAIPNRMEEDGPSWLPASLANRLLLFPWPGNVRQLRNTVRQLVIGCRGQEGLKTVPKVERMLAVPQGAKQDNRPVAPQKIHRNSSEIGPSDIKLALKKHDWELKASAVALGISRGTLYNRIKKMPEIRMAASLLKDEILEALAAHAGSAAQAARALEVSGPALQRRMSELGLS